ncbi:LacI family DNA-binding transcriptional regulator [Vallitalea okinawensis]|uniref:LacI family DNA-binding transcriptional regulator n=1 Tax=Vallitalea okinawensis TaxID=2078660 RepID=UPI000CFDF66A|nr:LacI family DNA-binding transcriptional regulator [Vallitalea okinawensis]
MATIKDVAKEARVSTATVSRVLNGNYPVSQDAKEKVENAIKALNYHPNAVARSLKQNKTYLIGVLVPDIANPYFMDLARGIESVVSVEGYNLVFGSTDEDASKEMNLLRVLNEKRVDAVVVATRQEKPDKINELINQGLNILMVDTYIKDIKCDYVVEDDYDAAYRLVKHLIEHGHTQIAIVNGLLSVSTSQQRLRAYKDALEEYGIPINDKFLLQGDYNRECSYQSMKQLLKEEVLPTAIFSTNNIMTESVMLAAKEAGLSIPEDLSLVSFGNITLPGLIEPQLTYIKQNSFEMGKRAGNLILDKLDHTFFESKEHIIHLDMQAGDSVKDMH